MFLIASRFNHACKPMNNVAYVYDPQHDVIVLSAQCDIKAGEELFIIYGQDPELFYTAYGFICRCGGCRSLTEVEIADLERPIR